MCTSFRSIGTVCSGGGPFTDTLPKVTLSAEEFKAVGDGLLSELEKLKK